MKGQYTHYILMPNTDTAKAKVITNRYNWTSLDEPDYPTSSNTNAEIKSFCDTWKIDYNSSDTKSQLLNKVENAKPVGTTVSHNAKVSDLNERHPHYFAPRVSSDGTEMLIKSDFTIAELNALPTGFTAYTNEEIRNYIATSDKWKVDEV